MAENPQKSQKSQISTEEIVTVTFVSEIEQAREYETILKANDIPAMVKVLYGTDEEQVEKIAIMVPESYLDEAHVIIESQDAYDDFYDLSLDDEDEDDGFASGIFEEDDF